MGAVNFIARLFTATLGSFDALKAETGHAPVAPKSRE